MDIGSFYIQELPLLLDYLFNPLHLKYFSPSFLDVFSSCSRDFPTGPVVKTLPSNTEGVSLIPGQGTKISQSINQNMRNKQANNIVTNSINIIKVVHINKIFKNKEINAKSSATVFSYPELTVPRLHNLCFLDFNVHRNHLRIWLNGGFCFSGMWDSALLTSSHLMPTLCSKDHTLGNKAPLGWDWRLVPLLACEIIFLHPIYFQQTLFL